MASSMQLSPIKRVLSQFHPKHLVTPYTNSDSGNSDTALQSSHWTMRNGSRGGEGVGGSRDPCEKFPLHILSTI